MAISEKGKKQESLEKYFKRMDYNRSILEVLIYFASGLGKKRLPTIKEFILSEVAAGIIEYITEEKYLFTYRRSGDGKESIVSVSGWEWKTNNAMERALGRAGKKLNPVLMAALKEITFLMHSSDAMGAGGWSSRLYADWPLICPVIMKSTFSLSVEFVERVGKKVIPKLDVETLRHCKAIAKLMEGYVSLDVKLIGERYLW